MNIFNEFQTVVKSVVKELQAQSILSGDVVLDRVTVEPPRDASHGDLATNVAMVLAKGAGMPPRDLATKIAEELQKNDDIAEVEVAGPGFINMRLNASYWTSRVATVLEKGLGFGSSTIGKGEKVNVEYVSANPTGPMHVGHVRGAVFGDALANLLEKAGYVVTKEYYINDAGVQIDVLARSAYLRYREAMGEDIGAIPEGLYPGDYLVPVGERLKKEHGDALLGKPEAEWLDVVRDVASEMMMDMIRDDLACLGIEHEVFFSERELHASSRIQDTIDVLDAKGLIYEGVLEPPKGKKPDDWEPRPQTLFRATEFGDDVDRALKKSDGAFTYFAADIAYHYDKVVRGYDHLIDVLGADHGGYAKRIRASVNALSDARVDLDVRLCQLVRLLRNGEPVKMSKRAGTFVTLREVVEEVGCDVTRFIMLTRKNDAGLDFDFAKVTEQSKDNPVFYVQYAHARVHSVLGKAVAAFPDMDVSAEALKDADFSILKDDAEIALIRRMIEWPRLVEAAAASHEPHRVAFYLYDLASEFHSLWNKGHDRKDLRFVQDGDEAATKARLGLIVAMATVIASGLGVLGVKPVKEMH